MNIKLIYISKNKSNNIEFLVEDYEKKINHFISYSSIGLKNKNQKSEKKLIQKSESNLILKNIKNNDLVILLDEKGKEFSTKDFSKFISDKMMNRTKNIVFIIGGAYGFSSEFKKKFKLKIALSKLTFSHDMARLFFSEQLYRSLTIINNIPYHNQ
ncbi:MAG: 23S rRNA (pseudouridine(1915)-N(3))-methyltransferase RlmH [Gammaproteobacteria bacterium]|nr:23S rRNA (pseudouridine(1915)-N(3))-methyltransferase RlmH [Gammaproteobacteria bacterium]|tara:strand:- start:1967 stop:2434 length:468 start_codon:yes stop_codon:yes gene_type:complete